MRLREVRAGLALKQLEFVFLPQRDVTPSAVVGRPLRLPICSPPVRLGPASDALALQFHARELLREFGAAKLAREIRVEWNSRMRTAAGRADYREKLISLNLMLRDHGDDEIERTLRHELAHLLAQFRVGRRRIAPHGAEWREACRDLGIADEARYHNLPFASKVYPPRYVYRCPNCKQEFPRVRRTRRAIACLACCRSHNHGEFDPRFRLRLISKL